jgi:hypothetical protein
VRCAGTSWQEQVLHTGDEHGMLMACVRLQVPMIGGTGNHEEEQEADGSIFKSVQARWPVSSTRLSRHTNAA